MKPATSYRTTCDLPLCSKLEAAINAQGHRVWLSRQRPGSGQRTWETTCPAATVLSVARLADVPLHGWCDLTRAS